MLDRGLNDRELVAAQPGDLVLFAETAAQAVGHGFQKLIANRMAKRVVGALELVKVQIEDCKMLAMLDACERRLQLFAQQEAIGQIG
jgi:hypothetical protein